MNVSKALICVFSAVFRESLICFSIRETWRSSRIPLSQIHSFPYIIPLTNAAGAEGSATISAAVAR